MEIIKKLVYIKLHVYIRVVSHIYLIKENLFNDHFQFRYKIHVCVYYNSIKIHDYSSIKFINLLIVFTKSVILSINIILCVKKLLHLNSFTYLWIAEITNEMKSEKQNRWNWNSNTIFNPLYMDFIHLRIRIYNKKKLIFTYSFM